MAEHALLELFGGILDAGEKQDDGKLIVLPVVHDGLASDHELLHALCSRYGGIYLRSDGEPGARAPINTSLADLVKQTCKAEALSVEIEEKDDLVFAHSPDFPKETVGIATLLRVIEALCSAAILDHPLVVISYDLDGLDPTRERLLWTLTTLVVENESPPGMRVFVPIAGGTVDVEHHCEKPVGSMRFAIRDGEFVKRGPARSLDDALRVILTRLDQPLVLFLGAGASESAGISMGDAIRDEAISRIVGKPVSSPDLPRHFRDWVAAQQPPRWMQDEEALPIAEFARKLTLERVLREVFWNLGGGKREDDYIVRRLQIECASALDHMPPSRKALAKLVLKLPKLVVATVNFDRLIEDGHDEYVVMTSKDEFEIQRDVAVKRIRDGNLEVPILKIHGSIENPETMVAEIEETRRGLPKQITDTLDCLFVEEALTWIWIGCSMRDVDVNQWLLQKNGAKDIKEWFVDPLPGQGIREYAAFDRQIEWAGIGVSIENRLVTETANKFLVGLLERADELESQP